MDETTLILAQVSKSFGDFRAVTISAYRSDADASLA
jgi:hypothetical protein